MKRFRSPVKNRRGIYEEHDVPSRKEQLYLSRGWVDVTAQKEEYKDSTPAKNAMVDMLGNLLFSGGDSKEFKLSGNWVKKRIEVKEIVNAEVPPTSKHEARTWLEEAGFTVIE